MTTTTIIPQDADKIRQAALKAWPDYEHTPSLFPSLLRDLQQFLAIYQALMNSPAEPQPFDLEKAKAGEAVVTRDGRKWELLKVLNNGVTLAGVVTSAGGHEILKCWYEEDGRFYHGGEHQYDLFMAPTAQSYEVKWANIYKDDLSPDGQVTLHSSKQQADERANDDRFACVAIALPKGGR